MLLVVARRRRLIPVADPDAGRFGFVIV
ncbi:MAG: hypothetical protein QOH83_938, partial [Solirubrobacteraceae bacterium]|nr:hypothetical protein [Solirubrobacteraceae bacterium]